jgi:septum formation protein
MTEGLILASASTVRSRLLAAAGVDFRIEPAEPLSSVPTSYWSAARYDKPADLGQAPTQLQALRGRTHELVTAVCAVQDGSRLSHAVSSPRLTMRHFTDAFVDDYISAEGAGILRSVGAYRLEGRGVQLFEHVEGDYFAILGLPLLELLGFLRNKRMILS